MRANFGVVLAANWSTNPPKLNLNRMNRLKLCFGNAKVAAFEIQAAAAKQKMVISSTEWNPAATAQLRVYINPKLVRGKN